jgi:hypothetical protein
MGRVSAAGGATSLSLRSLAAGALNVLRALSLSPAHIRPCSPIDAGPGDQGQTPQQAGPGRLGGHHL